MSSTSDRSKERDHIDHGHLAPIENTTDMPRWQMALNGFIHKNHSTLAPYWELATATNAKQRENAQFFIDQHLLKEAVKTHCEAEVDDDGAPVPNDIRALARVHLNEAVNCRANLLLHSIITSKAGPSTEALLLEVEADTPTAAVECIEAIHTYWIGNETKHATHTLVTMISEITADRTITVDPVERLGYYIRKILPFHSKEVKMERMLGTRYPAGLQAA